MSRTASDQQLTDDYYARVPEEDLAGRSAAALDGVVAAHASLAAGRAAGQAAVRVWTPTTETDGFSLGRSVVDAATEDMPFLVDSLLAELTRRHHAIRLAVHPRMGAESWLHIEVDRVLPGDVADLEAALSRVLADVRAVVDDTPAMAQQCRDLADVVPDAETAALLRWTATSEVTLLGANGLGLLRQAATSDVVDDEGPPLQIRRGRELSTVRRSSYPEEIVVRHDGRTHRFLAHLALAASTGSVLAVPVLRAKAEAVLAASGFALESHSGRDLLAILESYPVDELFQSDLADLERVTREVSHLQERRRLRLFLRRDEAGQFMSCLLYLPRDLYTRKVRLRLQEVLVETFAPGSMTGTSIYTARVTESVLARLLIVVGVGPGEQVAVVDAAALERRLAKVARSWVDDLAALLAEGLGEARATALLTGFPSAFPEAYQADLSPEEAAGDLRQLAALEAAGGLAMHLSRPAGSSADQLRLKVFSREVLSLSAALPVLAHMAVDVVDSRPYVLRAADGTTSHLYVIGLQAVGKLWDTEGGLDALFRDAFTAVWTGEAEDDGWNALVLRGGLGWRQVAILRAYGLYLRQSGWTFSPEYVETALTDQVTIARLLVELFETRFEPDETLTDEDRAEHCAGVEARLATEIEAVESRDTDRICRALLATVLATTRTNAFQRGRPCLAMKLDPSRVPELPAPRPAHEIWVCSPRVEGVHLRFGPVARGGLRWSDRREDFRTEVLGLVKAQTVKNAVIVPVGAKGGFVPKRLPPASEREAWLAEGTASYQDFVRSLLDVTDNLVDGAVVPPTRVVRHDGDDPYLVVAADKGTATFSDTANALARQAGFWLDDAFASGGSAGYDHKAMGITARGAWASVQRHFRELGVDPQVEDVTAVGVGDMSGDVFGNGMLLSEHLRLVAAFDHRHVFLDPDPDAAVSFVERRRLAALPRSSWADYDVSLLSSGGGVFARTAKRVTITDQVRRRLDLPDGTATLTPPQLISAILRAPVDLLWNGAIGTYVKSTAESHADVGDKANDGVRVDGADLRCRVVGEGGNLGFTQLGRIEAATLGVGGTGVRLNTDAIDNAAGVDCSDHEVNIKILLTAALAAGDLAPTQRDPLLASMTDDVAGLVLAHNVSQNLMLSVARSHAPAMLPVHSRMITALVEAGVLDRALEALPSPKELDNRAAAGRGLTSPELAVLAAYAKITLKQALLAGPLPVEPWTTPWLDHAFPDVLVDRFAAHLTGHRLRPEIVATALTNDLVDRGGMTFVLRATEETGAPADEVVRAYAVVRAVFDLPGVLAEVDAAPVTAAVQVTLHLAVRRLMDRAVRWWLEHRRSGIDVAAEISAFQGPLAELLPKTPGLLCGAERESLTTSRDGWVRQGVPEALALRVETLLHAFQLLDVIGLAEEPDDLEPVATLHLMLSAELGVDRLLDRISALPRAERWAGLARQALREDTYDALAGLTADVLATTDDGPAVDRIAAWQDANANALGAAFVRLSAIAAGEASDLATLTVAVRTFRSLLRA